MIRFKDLLIRLCLTLFFILPAFLLGGVYSHTVTNLVIMTVFSVITVAFSIYLLVFKKDVAVTGITLILFMIFVYSVLQLIPLPEWMLKIISPAAYYFHAIEGGGLRPLTLSVTDTVYSAMRIAVLIFLSIFITKAVYLGKKKWKQIVIDTIIYVSSAVVFVSVVMRIIHAEKWLYGTLRNPGFLIDPIIINPNHAASLFGIGAILSLTSVYSTEFERKRIFYGTLFFLNSVAVAATLSRGGTFAFLTALVFFAFMKKIESEKTGKIRIYITVAAFVLSLFVVFQTGYSFIEREFDFGRDGYFEKIDRFDTVSGYLSDFFPAGSGLGSFSKVYTVYQENPETRFYELENEPVQFMLETGVFFSLFIFIFLVFIIVRAQRDKKRNAGFITALFFVLIHNTVDFNLHNFSTLVPVVAVLVLVLDPVRVNFRKRKALIFSLIAVSLSIILMAATAQGRKMAGYGEYSYDELIYNQPADYSAPMEKVISVLNSGDRIELIESASKVSALVTKAPKYYYSYYLAGTYFLRMNSLDQATEFFKKSLEISGDKYQYILRKIYADMRAAGIGDKIFSIISISDSTKEKVERFIRDISGQQSGLSDFIHENEERLYLSAIKNYILKDDDLRAEKLILKVESEQKHLKKEERGKLLMLRGDINYKKGQFLKAYENYSAGSELTESFSDALRTAYTSLKLDKKKVDDSEKVLKRHTLKSKGTLYQYYKWLASREFMYGDHAQGLKYLEKAADMSNSPGWRFELAARLSSRGMHFHSVKQFLKLQKQYPEYRKEEVESQISIQKQKLTEKDEKNLKEHLLQNF